MARQMGRSLRLSRRQRCKTIWRPLLLQRDQRLRPNGLPGTEWTTNSASRSPTLRLKLLTAVDLRGISPPSVATGNHLVTIPKASWNRRLPPDESAAPGGNVRAAATAWRGPMLGFRSRKNDQSDASPEFDAAAYDAFQEALAHCLGGWAEAKLNRAPASLDAAALRARLTPNLIGPLHRLGPALTPRASQDLESIVDLCINSNE